MLPQSDKISEECFQHVTKADTNEHYEQQGLTKKCLSRKQKANISNGFMN